MTTSIGNSGDGVCVSTTDDAAGPRGRPDAIPPTGTRRRHVMRKILAVTAAVALIAGAATFAGLPWPGFATAQGGGGTLEVEVKYNGAPVVEKIKINKDTEKCGT